MCGIVGSTHPGDFAAGQFARMVGALHRRGPDAEGTWGDGDVLLGHRRLAVLDLTPAGAQPMATENGRTIAVYNGECYNHLELRPLVAGARWRSTCDTETLLRLFGELGTDFIDHVVGMFALAIYDRPGRRLLLFRDRLGEKPLYYWHQGTRFAFASDLKALMLHPRISREVDPRAARDFLLHNYIPGGRSILAGVRRLGPGRMLEFNLVTGAVEVRRYWNPLEAAAGKRVDMTEPEAAAELERLLAQAVRGQRIADVPLGCFLSGGIDSSVVAAMLQRMAGNGAPARAFTIAFREDGYDESWHARSVARHLGMQHTILTAKPSDCLDLIDEIPEAYAEPFADASMLPTMLLSRLAREHVTVALSGDGGDELFLGYDRYRWAARVAAWHGIVGPGMVHAGARLARAIPSYRWQVLGQALAMPPEHVYTGIFTGWNAPFADRLFRPLAVRPQRLARLPVNFDRAPAEERAGLQDLLHYLPDDILVKVDRAAMHASLETRAPMLDHRVVEFALGLPVHFRMKGREQKIVLRRVLHSHVPAEFFDRPKAGFAVPLRHWMRGPLRPLLAEHLGPRALARHDFFNPAAVAEMRARHDSGKWNFERQLWALLMFQLWFARYMA